MNVNCSDSEVIARLYRKTGPFILMKCNKMVANRAVAEEILQEVYLSLFHKKPMFEAEKQAFRWLYKSAHNRCIDFIRRAHNHLEVADETQFEFQPEENDFGLFLQSLANAKHMLTKIPKRSAEIIWYIAIDGLTQDEIAELLGVSRPTVARDLKVAKNQLKKMTEQVNV